ncbi:MAG: Ig domain-containing protein [Planctomycetes bacterium]|nr:Ig domain-containing protein [Planctomycetota bacterium]NUQ34831.1 hypothetical protein [Planctomycetaceae bacterium]
MTLLLRGGLGISVLVVAVLLGASQAFASLRINNTSLPDGYENVKYLDTMLVVYDIGNDAVKPFDWSKTSGLPGGLTVVERLNGWFITGTPDPGTGVDPVNPAQGYRDWTVTLKVVDSHADPTQRQRATKDLNLRVYEKLLTVEITNTSLKNATPGNAYSETLTAQYGTKPYQWNDTSGLPAWLSVSGDKLTGNVPAGDAGMSYDITLAVKDANGGTDTLLLTLTVDNPNNLEITTDSLVPGMEEKGYGWKTVQASGGAGNYTWTLTGTLPSGIVFGGGLFLGTPDDGTAAQSPYFITITVTDESVPPLSDSKDFEFMVYETIAVTTTQIPDAWETEDYGTRVNLRASSGESPYDWSGTTGLPDGMSVATGGTISGTPEPGTAGTWFIDAVVKDNNGYSASGTVQVIVNPPLTIGTDYLPDAGEGYVYGPMPLVASGGHTPYTWSVSGLPIGMTFDAATGEIGGTPAGGTSVISPYTIDISVEDSHTTPNTLATKLDLVVTTDIPPVYITTRILPDAIPGEEYTFQLDAIGGYPAYAFEGEQLPSGIRLMNNSGVWELAGYVSPNFAGQTLGFTVTATDSAVIPGTDTVSLSLRVAELPVPPVRIITSSLPLATIGDENYEPVELRSTGGEGPFSWTLDEGPDWCKAITSGTSWYLQVTIRDQRPAEPGLFPITITVLDATTGEMDTVTLNLWLQSSHATPEESGDMGDSVSTSMLAGAPPAAACSLGNGSPAIFALLALCVAAMAFMTSVAPKKTSLRNVIPATRPGEALRRSREAGIQS